MFTVAASFGNVHGVYAVGEVFTRMYRTKSCSPLQPGNVKLSPIILSNSQRYVQEKLGTKDSKPVYFVFHGGSGSEKDKIAESLEYGVIKMVGGGGWGGEWLLLSHFPPPKEH